MESEGSQYFYGGFNYGYLIAGFSAAVFILNNKFVLTRITPLSARRSGHREWKWRNIANSLIHSTITGIGACVW